MAKPLKIKNSDGSYSYKAKVYLGRDRNGKQIFKYKTFSNPVEARRWAVKTEAGKSDELQLMNSSMLFEEYVDFFLERQQILQKEQRTYETWDSNLRKYIIPEFGHRKLNSISYSDCEHFQINLVKLGLMPATVNKICGLLGKILKYATEGEPPRRQLTQNPFNGIKKIPIQDDDMDFWEDSDVQAFFSDETVKNNFYRDVYLFAINTGFRLGEIAGLQVKKIDLVKNHIVVSEALKRSKKKRAEKGRLGPTKNKLTRYFPMNKTVLDIVNRNIKGKRPDDFVFNSKEGYPNIDLNHFGRDFKTLQEGTPVESVIRFHDLRHTFASHFMMRGGDIFTLQKLLGHKDIKTTMIYAHLSPTYLQEARNVVEFSGVGA